MRYTIRKLLSGLDAALRRRAREKDQSLNHVVIEALSRGAGVSTHLRARRDLRDIAGTWQEDREFAQALAAQQMVDRELWSVRRP